MKKAKKGKRSIFVRLLVLGVCVYMLATITSLWNTLNKDRIRLAELEKEYEEEQLEVEELKKLLDSGSKTGIIEKAARERLGFVYSDEEIYIDISGN